MDGRGVLACTCVMKGGGGGEGKRERDRERETERQRDRERVNVKCVFVFFMCFYLEEACALGLLGQVELEGCRLLGPSQRVLQHLPADLVEVLHGLLGAVDAHVRKHLLVGEEEGRGS
jgi:hypothetical protein